MCKYCVSLSDNLLNLCCVESVKLTATVNANSLLGPKGGLIFLHVTTTRSSYSLVSVSNFILHHSFLGLPLPCNPPNDGKYLLENTLCALAYLPRCLPTILLELCTATFVVDRFPRSHRRQQLQVFINRSCTADSRSLKLQWFR